MPDFGDEQIGLPIKQEFYAVSGGAENFDILGRIKKSETKNGRKLVCRSDYLKKFY